jgi:1-acyl-sn-glycerol-3-phosphate acyltransferase
MTFLIRSSIVRWRCKNEISKNSALAAIVHHYTKKILKLFRVNVSVTGSSELSNNAPCLIVSNHLSYLDVLMLTSVKPTIFLSHKGIEREPVIGTIVSGGGTIFLDKSAKTKLSGEMRHLSDMLKDGNTMTIFPEGGTGDGEGVRTFHPALIEAAVRAGTPVLPVCLQYSRINGESVTKENKDLIFIYGDTPFLPHIWKIFKKLDNLDVTVKVFDKIPVYGANRKAIAIQAREKIAGEFIPV